MKPMKKRLFLPALLLVAGGGLFSASAYAAPPTAGSNGILVDHAGMTLYTFDKDVANSGKSACAGPCAANWPPLTDDKSDKASGDFSIITREDGTRQWAHKGQPLYLYKSDQKPGDKTGDNFRDIWHAAKR